MFSFNEWDGDIIFYQGEVMIEIPVIFGRRLYSLLCVVVESSFKLSFQGGVELEASTG